MGLKRFIFCVSSVAILSTTTLPNANAGPYDKEIGNLQKQISEVNSDIDEIKRDVNTEEQKIVNLQNELLEIDETIAETEALINSEDTQLVKHPIVGRRLHRRLVISLGTLPAATGTSYRFVCTKR